MRLALLAVVALTAACAGSPLSPTRTPLHDLRWDVIAPGCAPATPIPNLNHRLPDIRDGLRGLWLMTEVGTVRTYIAGDFVSAFGVHALCTWDTLIRDIRS